MKNSFYWERDVGSNDQYEDAIKRFLGAMLVAGMPAEGLEETFDALKDIYEFSVERSRCVLPERETVRKGTGIVKTVIKSSDWAVQE